MVILDGWRLTRNPKQHWTDCVANFGRELAGVLAF
jgi:hypothetical protein